MRRSTGKQQQQQQTAEATAMSSGSDSRDASKRQSQSQPREQQLWMDEQDGDDGLLLHLIRTVTLYLYVLLSQAACLSVTDAEAALMTSDADAQTAKLQQRLHAALLAWVQSEVASNQFDGLLQEQRAFLVVKRLFRQQRAKAAAQCRVLAALLTSYMTRLQTPLVLCEPCSMLSSTLGYLLAKESVSDQDEPVPLPILYPLVNAVDSLSVEQRECLDALTTLLRWLSARDRSNMLFSKFVRKHHLTFIQIADLDSSTNRRSISDASAASTPTTVTMESDESDDNLDEELSSDARREELGVCFVQMLLRHSDHIFRRDPEFIEETPAMLYSDTEDDDLTSEDGSSCSPRCSSHEPTVTMEGPAQEKQTNSEASAERTHLNDPVASPQEQDGKAVEVVQTTRVSSAPDGASQGKKASTRSLRKRKKREEQIQSVARAKCGTNKTNARSIKTTTGHDGYWEEEEPTTTAVCVGIAAAAGTLAAVLCVIFT